MDKLSSIVYGQPQDLVRRTKGIHILTRRLTNNALVLFARTDGRLWFVIPWQSYSLIGTTDTDYFGDLDSIYASEADVNYLLAEAKRIFPDLNSNDVLYTYAGLRSLARKGGSTSNITRAHKLIDHETTDKIKGFISVLGGKITGYRAIAEEVTDLICNHLTIRTTCRTSSYHLPGGGTVTSEQIEESAQKSGLTVETIEHLVALYGSRFHQVLELVQDDRTGKQILCPHSLDIVAQVWHAVCEEGALTISDFLLRRGFCGFERCQGLDALDTVARQMGHLLDWDETERQHQVRMYRDFVALGHRYRQSANLLAGLTGDLPPHCVNPEAQGTKKRK